MTEPYDDPVRRYLKAQESRLAATGRSTPAVNIKLLVEGEEESGSSHLATLLNDNKERVAADLVLFSDTLLWHADHPAVCTGMRGMVSARLEVRGPLRDVHSGTVSGTAPNPVRELCALLGRLHDDKGRATIPGFYGPGRPSRSSRSWPATRSACPAAPSPPSRRPTSACAWFPIRRWPRRPTSSDDVLVLRHRATGGPLARQRRAGPDRCAGRRRRHPCPPVGTPGRLRRRLTRRTWKMTKNRRRTSRCGG